MGDVNEADNDDNDDEDKDDNGNGDGDGDGEEDCAWMIDDGDEEDGVKM